MTGDIPDFDTSTYDPATMAATSLITAKIIWYRRPWFLLTVAVILIVGVSVITDLPHHLSKAEDASAQNATMQQINTDIAPCNYAVKEAFSFYNDKEKGSLTPSNLQQIPHLLVADQSACSFTSGSIYDLTNNIQVLDTTAGKNLDHMLIVIVKWTTDDALAAIEDIQYLFVHPGDQSKIHNLTAQQLLLSHDRQVALADEATASHDLATTLRPLQLSELAHLIGT